MIQIVFSDLHWLPQDDQADDLCAHDTVNVCIDNETISDVPNKEWTLSCAGLYLLRSLEHDYHPGDYGSQLIPCCSFDFIPQENWQFPVLMLGCSNGIEWHIKHERNAVTHTTLNGNSSTLALHEWISLVLTLTNQVEEFYRLSGPKKTISKELEEGYSRFWSEWKEPSEERVTSHNYGYRAWAQVG
ncbi:hypothetical protein LEP1GSC043_0104 [Leptospira weilii str. Ecochallenge]|uniref:Uncharacterized protein n=1 Tax=Leptospira weilii str. Ecochallenge TaxID=1049986 RepID=N1U357_9LEPT|nr:hypothetical protein LEP1GSC043_0104 [Leptospira weilii str. Ecochallenge]